MRDVLFRYEDIPVEATGSDVPAAIETFADVSSIDFQLCADLFLSQGVNDSSDERKHRAGSVRPTNACAEEFYPGHHCKA